MSPWKLVYCFTKKLSLNESDFNTVLYSLNKSIEMSSKFHKIKIMTDNETLEYIKNIDVDYEIFEFDNFRFLDDIKIKVLPHIKNDEVLIDPDVFLFEELKIDKLCDLFAERPESINDKWYVEDYESSKKFEFSNYIKFESLNGDIVNIGILKFFNKQLERKYIENYNKIKSIALSEIDNLEPFPKYSILLGQLLLQNIIDDNSYNVIYAKNNNEYYHLAGRQKYKNGYLKKLFNKNNKTIL